jgi:hypothetical protein
LRCSSQQNGVPGFNSCLNGSIFSAMLKA